MYKFNRITVTTSQLELFILYLQQKYEKQLTEIEQSYPITWYMEMNNHQIWAPSTTLAFTHLGKQKLSVCFLLHNIEKEINTKHSITDPLLLKNVSECFVEFLFLHELKHMQQFCNGLTLKQYKKLGSYKTNPHEEQATHFALETMKQEHPETLELLQFILNKGKINRLNESKWQQHFMNCK